MTLLRTACIALALGLAGCANGPADRGDLSERTVRAVATTSMVADLVREIGGERVVVEGLMGPNVDPHLYRPTEGDVTRMTGADVIFFNGLHLEGKMAEVLEQVEGQGIAAEAVAEAVPEARLLAPPEFEGNYDPHVWMDVQRWKAAAGAVADRLAALDTTHAEGYRQRLAAYTARLDALDRWVRGRVAEVPEGQRVLVTAHDAFNYFGDAYGFDVRGLQGISTATEAGTADVQELARFVAERRIPAMFVESSISPRSIEAVQEAVRARGFNVRIGGSLYSDALGGPGTGAETYEGMIRHNVNTIVDALVPQAATEPGADGLAAR
ncbi:MAG: zinc ABC transporter substrate-binding protein [Rubricoccaceae bacterium]|nr:zinc ABC transporter substrate-binding protein [Rubricoccaceae bacterium]